ncbi:hypothetical protein HJFPF1_02066 [Paramyrothecium foliicola]|nr:hypothetical protein HJFPF1_02066 [Paramyrothecium foliicola]
MLYKLCWGDRLRGCSIALPWADEFLETALVAEATVPRVVQYTPSQGSRDGCCTLRSGPAKLRRRRFSYHRKCRPQTLVTSPCLAAVASGLGSPTLPLLPTKAGAGKHPWWKQPHGRLRWFYQYVGSGQAAAASDWGKITRLGHLFGHGPFA